jgi:hypothetical protein
VLPWCQPEPSVTVIVKATLALGVHGRMTLADMQEPLACDLPALGGDHDELVRATDFVPRKRRCDVMLVGHARARSPSRVIEARLSVGSTVKSFYALADDPARDIALVRRHLRRAPAGESAVRVGPRRAAVSRWSHRTASNGFDFGMLNVAPADQQLDALVAHTPIELDGLLSTGAWRAELPRLEPRAFWLPSRSDARWAEPVPLVCDTLCIDVDVGVATLTWRGEVPELAQLEHDNSCLAVVAGDSGWSMLMERLDDAEWVRAATEDDPEVRPLARSSRPLGSWTPPSMNRAREEVVEEIAKEPAVELETYVEIKIAIERTGDLEEVLADHRIDEARWRAIERAQAMALARDMLVGGRLAERLREALSAARSGRDDD